MLKDVCQCVCVFCVAVTSVLPKLSFMKKPQNNFLVPRNLYLWTYLRDRKKKVIGWSYLLTPWSRVLLEKLASLQLVKKFPAFYGTRRFLTALTNPRHRSLSWASPVQSSYPNPTSWRSILILSYQNKTRQHNKVYIVTKTSN